MGYLEEKADKVINTHVLVSMGAGAIPIPFLDVAAVSAIQLDLIRELSYIYDVEFSDSVSKNLISALAGGTLAKIGASLIKTIPGIGTLLGGASMVALSGASTYAIGQVFVKHLKQGGILSNFDFDWAKNMYKEEFEKGKKYAEKAKKEPKKEVKKEQETLNDIFSKIEKLSDLRDSGILTEDEFQDKKKKLLELI
ncbi:MAG: hypothetical protein ACJAWV_002949 [Flammeovirgaceae bacterium]|jgi:uncharacterized protein (DUF697 family)